MRVKTLVVGRMKVSPSKAQASRKRSREEKEGCRAIVFPPCSIEFIE
jgi:hypothetical protein